MNDELTLLDAYWRAANYLSVGQIYLLDNPLLREPLAPEHIKPRLLGHWGTTPGLNFLYAHMNRAIRARDLDAIYVTGPGHGGPGAGRQHLPRGHLHRGLPAHRPRRGGPAPPVPPVLVPRRHPEPRRARDAGLDPRGRRARLRAAARLRRGVRQPRPARRLRGRRRRGRDRPAGGELALEQVPRTRPATARCCRSCTSTATRSPTRRCSRGSPTRSCARCSRATATRRASCEGSDPEQMHQLMAATLDEVARRDRRDPAARARARVPSRPRWPMIVLRTPKGWTGPEDGRRPAGRGHVPLPPGAARRRAREPRAPRRSSRRGCAPTGPRSCSTTAARCAPSSPRWRPTGERRMGANPHANGGLLLRDLELPDFRRYAVEVPAPGARAPSEATRVLGDFLRDVMRPRTPTASGSWAPTRRRPTGSRPCSR